MSPASVGRSLRNAAIGYAGFSAFTILALSLNASLFRLSALGLVVVGFSVAFPCGIAALLLWGAYEWFRDPIRR